MASSWLSVKRMPRARTGKAVRQLQRQCHHLRAPASFSFCLVERLSFENAVKKIVSWPVYRDTTGNW